MGADLYIQSGIDTTEKDKWEEKFNKAVEIRNAIPKDNELARNAAQEQVMEYYDKMYDADLGYFRDSYNPTSLLWQYGLSWWTDVGDMLDEEGNLSPAEAQKLLDIIKAKEITEVNRSSDICIKDEDGYREEEWLEYFQDKRERFITFLKTAIDLNEPIYCSI